MADIDKQIHEACQNNNELGGFKVVDLKLYLANRKQNVSGRKAELIERVKGTYKLSIKSKHKLAEEDETEQKQIETERFVLSTGEVVPNPDELPDWSDNCDCIPEVSVKDIYNYIVLKKNSKRQLKAKGYYEERHVYNVEVHQISLDSSHCFVRARVLPSFPTADQKKSPAYQTWVLLSKVTGCIHSACCNCPAGQGECCNHISALLYAIGDKTQKQKDGELAATSRPCIWNNHSMMKNPRQRKLTPRKSEDVTYCKQRQGTHPARKLNLEKDHELNKINGCTANVERFKKRLEQEYLNVGWLKNFPPTQKKLDVPTLKNVSFMFCDTVNLQSEECRQVFRDHFQSLALTDEEVTLTEILTRVQGSPEWKLARQERLTSSYFGRICMRKPTTAPDRLIKDILYNEFTSKYTEYGKRHEKAARKMYVKKMQSEHSGICVKDSGLIVTRQYPFLGTSPDGIVYCSHCTDSVGLLEIKCPASMRWRMATPEECCKDKDFFCTLQDGVVSLKKNHTYYYQVQGQMGISGRLWCDFVVWTCTGINIEHIHFDPVLWKEMVTKLKDFYVSSFLPELFTQRVRRGLKLFE